MEIFFRQDGGQGSYYQKKRKDWKKRKEEGKGKGKKRRGKKTKQKRKERDCFRPGHLLLVVVGGDSRIFYHADDLISADQEISD